MAPSEPPPPGDGDRDPASRAAAISDALPAPAPEDLRPPWPVGPPDNLPPPPESMRARAHGLLQRLSVVPDLHPRARLLVGALQEVTREEAATLLAELLRAARTHPAGRAMHVALAAALGDPTFPEGVLQQILREAGERGDWQVGNLLQPRGAYVDVTRRPPPPPPPGSPSRELTLGERRSLARRPDRVSLEKLLLDPDPLVIRSLLPNARLVEDDVLRIACRRPCRAEVLAEIYQCPRWVCRPRIQLALVLNPYNRTEISLRLVPLLPVDLLRQVAQEGTIDPLVRWAATSLLAERG
ncbi:MAG: hypothetical protein RBU45_01420 [Myxococcota bacterium]|nr:hypothetical protein [Myxococcota bacterium]